MYVNCCNFHINGIVPDDQFSCQTKCSWCRSTAVRLDLFSNSSFLVVGFFLIFLPLFETRRFRKVIFWVSCTCNHDLRKKICFRQICGRLRDPVGICRPAVCRNLRAHSPTSIHTFGVALSPMHQSTIVFISVWIKSTLRLWTGCVSLPWVLSSSATWGTVAASSQYPLTGKQQRVQISVMGASTPFCRYHKTTQPSFVSEW